MDQQDVKAIISLIKALNFGLLLAVGARSYQRKTKDHKKTI